MDDEAWEDELEDLPIFIVSQLRVGQVLTDRDVAACQAVVTELDNRENTKVEEFHEARLNTLREIGGEELVIACQMKDAEQIAKITRKAMDRLFPKHQRKLQ